LTNSTQSGVGTIFCSTADKTVATASETTVFGTGTGTQTITANSVAVGTKFRIRADGVYTTPVGNTATMAFNIKWGSAAIGAATAAPPASQTNAFSVLRSWRRSDRPQA